MQKLWCQFGFHKFTSGRCTACGRMKRFECLIFDFGNVIAFFDHMLACERLAAMGSGGLTSGRVYEAIFQSGLERTYDRGEISTDEFLEALRTRLKIDPKHTTDDLVTAWCDIFRPNEPVIRFLAELHEDCAFRLVIASNTNELHYRWYSDKFAVALKHFDSRVLSFEIGSTKPDSEFFARCIDAAHYEPSECVYIDDVADYVDKAREAGMHGIAFKPDCRLRRELREAGVNDFALVNPRPADGSAQDAAFQIYQQKYLQYRHFDALRWQIPGALTTLGVLMLSFGLDRAITALPYMLLAYGLLAWLCGYFLQRITHHHELNTAALRRVARRLGDWSVPGPTSELHPLRSVAVWFTGFVYLLSIAAFIGCLAVFFYNLFF